MCSESNNFLSATIARHNEINATVTSSTNRTVQQISPPTLQSRPMECKGRGSNQNVAPRRQCLLHIFSSPHQCSFAISQNLLLCVQDATENYWFRHSIDKGLRFYWYRLLILLQVNVLPLCYGDKRLTRNKDSLFSVSLRRRVLTNLFGQINM